MASSHSRIGVVIAHRKILATLVKRDLRVRYSQSFLGYLWTVIEPLANALVYFVVFALIFQRPDAGYPPYFIFLLTGLLPWQWFNASVSESMRALLTEAKLVRSTSIPRELWVMRVVLAKGIEFVLSLPVLLLFVVAYMILGTTTIDWQLIFFPVAIAIEFFLLVGIGLILAPLTVMIVDIQPSIRIFLRIMFYATPIIYSLDLAPGWMRILLWFNPMSGLLELFRAGFFDHEINWPAVAVGSAVALGLFFLGLTVFSRMEKSVLKEI